MKDNAFGDKKSIDFFFLTNFFCKRKKTKAITLPMFLSPYWSVQNLSLGHQAEEFMPLGKQVEEFTIESKNSFSLSLSFHFPCQKGTQSASQCFARWSRMTRTAWDTAFVVHLMGLSLVITVSMEVYVLSVYLTDVEEGYWMISCPRWGWSGLCSQFCHAVLLAHIFLCIIFLRNSEREGVQLNLRAGHGVVSPVLSPTGQHGTAGGPQSSRENVQKWMSSLQQWVTLEQTELSLAVGMCLLVLFHPKGPQPMYLVLYEQAQRWWASGRPKI